MLCVVPLHTLTLAEELRVVRRSLIAGFPLKVPRPRHRPGPRGGYPSPPYTGNDALGRLSQSPRIRHFGKCRGMTTKIRHRMQRRIRRQLSRSMQKPGYARLALMHRRGLVSDAVLEEVCRLNPPRLYFGKDVVIPTW